MFYCRTIIECSLVDDREASYFHQYPINGLMISCHRVPPETLKNIKTNEQTHSFFIYENCRVDYLRKVVRYS